MNFEGWSGRNAPPFDKAVLDVLRADDHLNRYYVETGQAASLFVGYFRSQTFGATIHSPLNCLPGSGWQPVRTELVPLADGGSMKRVLVQKGEERQLVLYWYQTARRAEGDEYRSKFYLVADAFRSRRNDAALVRVVVPIEPGRPDAVASASAAAERLASAVRPRLGALLFTTAGSTAQ